MRNNRNIVGLGRYLRRIYHIPTTSITDPFVGLTKLQKDLLAQLDRLQGNTVHYLGLQILLFEEK